MAGTFFESNKPFAHTRRASTAIKYRLFRGQLDQRLNRIDWQRVVDHQQIGHRTDDRRLLEQRSQPVGGSACNDVGAAAGGGTDQDLEMQQAPWPRGLIETASIPTTTHLIVEIDMIGVVSPLSIAVIHARRGVLGVLSCRIRRTIESFGSATRENGPLDEAKRFFLAALRQPRRWLSRVLYF